MSPLAIAIGDALGFSGQGGPGGGGGGGPVVPSLPTDQLAAHYKADAGINLTGSGITATVNQWDNQISANHNLTQANGVTWEPTYVPVSTVFAGRPMLYANADGLFPATVADDFTLSTSGVFTYAFVFKSDLQERYIWDARGNGSGQSRTAGYLENGIERTTTGGWVGVGPSWINAGYGGMQFGIKPYASGSNANLAPQSINNASYPNLFTAGLEIWVYVANGGYSFWSCNGRVLGNSAFMRYSTTLQQFNMMEGTTGDPLYDWPKADKLSPTVFGGYYGPQKGYGQGAMAEFLVYDKALTIEEHNDLVENLADKYKINYIKSTKIDAATPLDADFGDFKRGTASQINIAAPNDVYLNNNNYTQYFAMDVKKGIDFTRPGKYEIKIGENPAGGANPLFYPGFTFNSPNNAQMQQTAWTANNFPDLSTLKPASYLYWAYSVDQGQAPGIVIRKNADTTYSYVIGAGFSPVYYRIKDWTVFTAAGASPPFTIRMEWPGGSTWQGWKVYIDDVLVFDADQTVFQTMPDAANANSRALKQVWLPTPGFPYVYGRIGRVYDMKLLEGNYITAPWDYDAYNIVTEGLVAHWDAGSGVTLDGPTVAAWEDKVGGHVLGAQSGAQQPTFVATGSLNNQPSLDFDRATGQALFTSDTSFIPNTVDGGFTTLIVCKGTYSSGSQNWIMVGWDNGTHSQGFRLFKNGGTEQTQTICHTSPTTGTITSGYVNLPGGWQITGAQGCVASTMGHTGEAKRFYVRSNNREVIDTNGQTTYGATSYPGLYIGGYPDGSQGFDGEIMEVLVYNRLLSLSELQETEKKLMFKYQIFG